MWEIIFTIEVTRISFPSATILLPQLGPGTEVSISQDGGPGSRQYRIRFKISSQSSQKAEATARVEVNRLLDKLILQYGAEFRDFSFCAAIHHSSAGGVEIRSAPLEIGMSIHGDVAVGLGQAKIAAIATRPWTPEAERLTAKLREALALNDSISRFMGLYHILLGTCKDSQKKVDEKLLSLDPSIPQTPSQNPMKAGTMETVFTRLRNEVAHPRAGTSLDQTRTEIDQWAGNLTSLVRRVIQSLI